jgi:S-(hydroxymethyl)glutathione dehydrogenase/alcohol dehydrogenase
MKAAAAVMQKVNEPLAIEQVDLDVPARNEVLIRTAFAGVCHSDLHYFILVRVPACWVMNHLAS